jgi:hypothetical protein
LTRSPDGRCNVGRQIRQWAFFCERPRAQPAERLADRDTELY